MKFHSILLNEMNPLYDRNERISKVLSANYDKIIKLVDVTKIEKNKNIEIKREVNVYSCCIDCGGLLSRNTNTFKSNSASRPYFILKA